MQYIMTYWVVDFIDIYQIKCIMKYQNSEHVLELDYIFLLAAWNPFAACPGICCTFKYLKIRNYFTACF